MRNAVNNSLTWQPPLFVCPFPTKISPYFRDNTLVRYRVFVKAGNNNNNNNNNNNVYASSFSDCDP